MKRLPLTIILLVLFLAVFYNLGQIAPYAAEILAIGSFVYILTTIAIVFTILLRTFSQMRSTYMVGMWGLFYLFLKLAVFNTNPFWGGKYSFITIIEIGSILIGFALAQKIGSQLQDFQGAVEKILFANSPKSRKLSDEIENIKSEIYRSRRYQHPLTMIVFQPSDEPAQLMQHQSVKEVYNSLTSRFVALSMAKVLRENIRRSDQLIEQPEKGRYIVLAPETNKEQSDRVLEKIRKAARALGTDVIVGISSFPEDAANLEDLLMLAEVDLSENIKSAKNEIETTSDEIQDQ